MPRVKIPIYIVLFSSAELGEDSDSPIVHAPSDATGFTVPHLMAHDVATALPALWFCLHLPATFFELLDLPLRVIRESSNLSLGHYIWLAPVGIFTQEYFRPSLDIVPIVVIAPDDEWEQAAAAASALGVNCPILRMSQLSNDALVKVWAYTNTQLSVEGKQLGSTLTLSNRLDTAPTHLPLKWIARQMGTEIEREPTTHEEVKEGLERHLFIRLMAKSLAVMEESGVNKEEADHLLPSQMVHEFGRLRVPAVLSFPGVPTSYSKRTLSAAARARIVNNNNSDSINPGDCWERDMLSTSGDAKIERLAINFLVAHRAIARNGLGLALPDVPQRLFQILDQIERHCIAKGDGRVVWKLLARLNEAARGIWSEQLEIVVNRSSHLTVFSNFPLGLLQPPDASAPIVAYTPISQYPLLPLTRIVQNEIAAAHAIAFPKGRVRVLVAECIPLDDPVGAAARRGWVTAREFALEQSRPLDIEIVDIPDEARLRQELNRASCDILVISAHGFYDPRSNTAGLAIGSDRTIGLGLSPLPPVVILSACHVSPMGIAPVRIVDMLLREGAMAVLGTQIPVDVIHNAVLMGRFFLYIAESLAGNEPHVTLAEAWHRTQSSNAINDIANGSPGLNSWLLGTGADGVSRLHDFMANRSRSRIRPRHVYEDTEKVLIELADEEGRGNQIAGWLRRPGYLPESLFYTFWGAPERMLLNYPAAAQAEFD